MEGKQVIHLSRFKKVNENVLIDYPNQFEKFFENLDSKEDVEVYL